MTMPNADDLAVLPLFREAARLHSTDDLDAAEPIYRAILERQPAHAGALHLMGVLLGQRLKLKEAMTWLDRASDAPNQDLETSLCLAQALGSLGQSGAGLVPCERVLMQHPDNTAALYLRAELLQRNLDADTALEAIGHLRTHVAAGQADARVPIDWPSLLLEQGNLFAHEKRFSEAAELYEQSRRSGADPSVVDFRLASVGQQRAPDTPPRSMVRSLFDRYADRFDTHLRDHLAYRAPEVVAEVVAPLRAPGRLLATLDLGCGTGLSGMPMRAGASRLVGVDLSSKMVAQARERGIYDELHVGELLDYLEGRATVHAAPGPLPGPFDLALATDVLNYIGNLAPLHAALNQVLAPGGLFAFTVEQTADDGPPFVLNDSLRYAHSAAYVRALAADHGYAVLALGEAVLRKERDADVRGLVVVIRRG
ncbi:MAG: methyltransferase [Aquabacterium sp.]